MDRFRIKTGQGYSGCIPITVYWVQGHVDGFLGGEWVNIKGFENKQRAIELLSALER